MGSGDSSVAAFARREAFGDSIGEAGSGWVRLVIFHCTAELDFSCFLVVAAGAVGSFRKNLFESLVLGAVARR